MPITLHGTNGIDSPDFNATGSVVPANGMYLPSANTLAWTTNSTRNMTLDSSGNLGIGTSSPGFKLSVAGYSNVNSANKLAIGDVADYQARLYMESANETFTIENTSDYASSAIAFRINGSERARIDSSGNLLVGTTGNVWGARITTIGSGQAAHIETSSTTSVGLEVVVGSDGTGQNAFTAYSTAAGTTRMAVRSNGNVVNANNSYGAISDQRIKENIVDATPKLQDLLAVKIRNFNLKGGSAKQIGVVAQELEEVFPSLVEEDAEGIKNVKYSVFVPMLVKAIQELTQRLEALEAK